MFFKSLRRRSKSSSKSTTTTTIQPSSMDMTRITSLASSAPYPADLAVPAPPITILSTVGELGDQGTNGERVPDEGDWSRDYEEFLEKARREEERSEMAKAKLVRKARQTNMSPWVREM
ncbi:hypothetical protein B2J93_7804 [Marssonina coronariae]|uniref:Uncharacterized protein n=1 Tax=Diplocarpon coronariae TaxID=2795749 RepID=A0A218Z2S2_9HELO|nr:hypothetical protein B2J93_7804 [Marssonina coronariae]